MAVQAAVVDIHRSTLYDNDADEGGALYIGLTLSASGRASNIVESLFQANKARTAGGCLFGEGSIAFMKSSTVKDNVGLTEGGGIEADAAKLELHDMVISQNSAASGAGLYLHSGANVDLVEGILANNTAAAYGGGMRCEDSTISMSSGWVVADNSAVTNGGGLYIANCDASVQQGTISGNRATSTTSFVEGGGGVYASYRTTDTTRLTLSHLNMWANTAGRGGALYAVSESDNATCVTLPEVCAEDTSHHIEFSTAVNMAINNSATDAVSGAVFWIHRKPRGLPTAMDKQPHLANLVASNAVRMGLAVPFPDQVRSGEAMAEPVQLFLYDAYDKPVPAPSTSTFARLVSNSTELVLSGGTVASFEAAIGAVEEDITVPAASVNLTALTFTVQQTAAATKQT